MFYFASTSWSLTIMFDSCELDIVEHNDFFKLAYCIFNIVWHVKFVWFNVVYIFEALFELVELIESV